ncbi:MAG: single-stranded DNA-binding protein [Acidimicrobiales bacterium]|nr:single-stranded DNA-binding protein [Acidimicrobiales bacterium]
MSSPTFSAAGVNLAVLVGTLSRDPQIRTLPSGDDVLGLELTVRPEGGPAESVPVAWLGAPSAAANWVAGDEILVLGRVRRRYFRSDGVTQGRTEVVATMGVPTRHAARARRLLADAEASLELAGEPATA